jgi:hypothetical protein
MRKGAASGTFTDSIDVWQAFTKHTHKQHTHSDNLHHPYFNNSNDLLCLILQNHTPPSIQNDFLTNFFIAFHKDPDNLTCIHPLGTGPALRHLVSSLIMSIFHNEIIQYLVPDGQFGIAVPGGTYFIIHSTQSLMNQLLSKPSHLTRIILLLLDLINMFNEVLYEACHNVLTFTSSLSPII